MEYFQHKDEALSEQQADVTINTISGAETTVNRSHLITDLSLLNGPVIHVRATALHPDISYTTLPVNMNTTAHEVVFTIMEKHGQTSCYSAKEFYLAECVDSAQGNYKRMIPERERVLLIYQKWRKNDEEGYFLLCKNDETTLEQEGKETCILATVISPSESYEEGFLSPPHVVSHKDGGRHIHQRRLSLPTLGNTNLNSETNKENEETIIKDEQPVNEKELHENELKKYQGINEPMHKSLGQGGMSSIMNKVVQESKAYLGRRGSYSGNITPSRCKAGRETLQPLEISPQQSREIVHVEPLICSPSYSAVKLYPEFIFSPSDKPMETFISHPQIPVLETVTEQESDAIETQKESEKDLVPTVKKSKENNKDTESVKEDYPVLIHTVVVREHYPVHPKTMFIRPATSTDTQIQTQQETTDTSLIVASQKKEEPKLFPKTDVDLGGKKEENPKILKAKENSEMNLLDSLTSILDSKFSVYGVSSDTPDLEDTTEQLISPQRKKSLISEACHQVRKKRSSSSPAENTLTKRALSPSQHQPNHSDSTSVLISPTRRQQLIDAASEQIFESRRRKSFGDLPRKKTSTDQSKIDELVLLPKSNEKPHDTSATNTSVSSSQSDDHCDDKNGFTNGTADHNEPQTTCTAEQLSRPRSKSLLKRHKSDRSVRTRLFPFLSRKGGSKHKTTNDLNDPKAGDMTPPLSGSLTAFHRSRSTHFHHHTKELC